MHRPIAALLMVATLLAGCAFLEAPATGPLVTVEVRGGECPEGACGGTTAVERDGRVHLVAPRPEELGRAPAEAVGALDAAIRSADFEAIKSKPFTGECPVNFDGQEFIYEFSTPSGVQRIATCEVEIDPGHPLFTAVQAALDSAR
jgi:hypothetical protein